MNRFAILSGLIAVALTAFPGSASATYVGSTAGWTPTIHASSEGATTLHGVVDITCSESTVEGAVESHGAGVTVSGNISNLTFSKCVNNHVTVLKAGSLEIHTAGGVNGTVTSSGTEISVQVTSLGITCVFTTNGTHAGTLTGGAPATLHIDSASITRTGGSIFCGSSAEWTGSYIVDSPSGLWVDPA